jgi:hypothetical protein
VDVHLYPLWMVDLQKNYKHYDSPEIYFIFKFEDTKGTIKKISNRQCAKRIDKRTHILIDQQFPGIDILKIYNYSLCSSRGCSSFSAEERKRQSNLKEKI